MYSHSYSRPSVANRPPVARVVVDSIERENDPLDVAGHYTGLGDVHFHDPRHTGNTLAATGGSTTRDSNAGATRRCVTR